MTLVSLIPSFSTRWRSDVLCGVWTTCGGPASEPDQRIGEAIDLVEKKRDGDGQWPLEPPHAGEVHFDMEDGAGNPTAGTHSTHCECWTGIPHEGEADTTGLDWRLCELPVQWRKQGSLATGCSGRRCARPQSRSVG
jgi:hypothetical protein